MKPSLVGNFQRGYRFINICTFRWRVAGLVCSSDVPHALRMMRANRRHELPEGETAYSVVTQYAKLDRFRFANIPNL